MNTVAGSSPSFAIIEGVFVMNNGGLDFIILLAQIQVQQGRRVSLGLNLLLFLLAPRLHNGAWWNIKTFVQEFPRHTCSSIVIPVAYSSRTKTLTRAGYESHDFPTCSKYKPKAFTSKPGKWGGCLCAEADTRAASCEPCSAAPDTRVFNAFSGSPRCHSATASR